MTEPSSPLVPEPHLLRAERVLSSGGMVLVVGGDRCGKTALARLLADRHGDGTAVVDLDPYLDGLAELPQGSLVVTCRIGSGDRHAATAAAVARVAARRLPEFLLETRADGAGGGEVVGGGYVNLPSHGSAFFADGGICVGAEREINAPAPAGMISTRA